MSAKQNFFQGFCAFKLIEPEIQSDKHFVNDIPFTFNTFSEIPGSCIIFVDIVYPYYAVTNCKKHTVTESSRNTYTILSPVYPLEIRIDFFGPSEVVTPYVKRYIVSEDEAFFWTHMKQNT
uniref:Uncharacterized protein n=1 Tax=Panagrolaimus sp. ES5 TaxID=591445 RepID=A0AC34GM60_9BILA